MHQVDVAAGAGFDYGEGGSMSDKSKERLIEFERVKL